MADATATIEVTEVRQMPPPPTTIPPPPKSADSRSSLRLRTGGPVVEKLLATAHEALRRDDDDVELNWQTVETPCGTFAIYERTKLGASAASLALQHRILPSTEATGLRIWPCSYHLLEHLVAPTGLPLMAKGLGRPLRLIELGAGTGILGIGVSAALGDRASIVALTDPAIPIGGGYTSLDLLQRSVAANVATAPSAVARKLLWGDARDLGALRDAHGPFDVAIGSELLYREDSVGALVQTVQDLDVGTVVLAQQTRPAGMAVEHAAIELMQRAGYTVAQSPPQASTPAVIYTFARTSTAA